MDRFFTEQRIIRYAREHGSITPRQAARILETENQQAYLELERMRRHGRLKKISSSKGVEYLLPKGFEFPR